MPSVFQLWWFYVLRCADKSYYAGITIDVPRRIKLHNEGKGAKYLRPKTRRPARPVYMRGFKTKGEALVCEAEFKRLSRTEKDAIVKAGVWKKYDT